MFMKILVVHNSYQRSGGEDTVCNNEIQLLRQFGHEVREYRDDNRRIPELSNMRLAMETMWSRHSHERMSAILADFRADVVHVHNTFPLISPSVYYAAKKNRAAVVQTLHNFRLLCLNAVFLRDGKICEDCLTTWAQLPGIRHKCYRNGHIASAGVAAMVTLHRILKTWRTQVDIYLALSEFARTKFVAGGLPEHKIIVKPNCLTGDPGIGTGDGKFALYVGRLSPEKGIATLLSAWEKVGSRMPLKLAGDGPESARVQDAAARFPGVEWLGQVPHEQVLSLLKQSQFLVIPSTCYENFPLVAAEAFASGTPVVASDVGSLAQIVETEVSGLRFRPGDATDLSGKVLWLLDHPAHLTAMRRYARAEFDTKYSAAVNHERLMHAYACAIRNTTRELVVLPPSEHEHPNLGLSQSSVIADIGGNPPSSSK
jgi:glycosyltransferase involved in cell wall biosynthesis